MMEAKATVEDARPLNIRATEAVPYEIEVSYIKEEPEIEQLVSSDTGQSVKKEEIDEDDWQEVNHQQYHVESPSTSAAIKNLNTLADNSNLSYVLDIKQEMTEIHIYPDIIQRKDVPHEPYQLNISFESKAKSNDQAQIKEEDIDKGKPRDCERNIKESTQPEQCTEFQLYPCVMCLKTFNTKRSLAVHHDRVHVKEIHKCAECNKEYKCRSYLMVHMHKAHRKQGYKCRLCQDVCKSVQDLHDHNSKIHGLMSTDLSNQVTALQPKVQTQLYKCDKCPKVSLKSIGCLKRHVKNVHTPESHRCTQCNKVFKCEFYLYNHISYAHSNLQLECAVCKKMCKSKRALSIHYSAFHRSMSTVSPYICYYCQKVYHTKQNLVVHIQSIHREFFHQCPGCDMNFQAEYHLLAHMNKKHPEMSIRTKRPNKDNAVGKVKCGYRGSAAVSPGTFFCDHCEKVFHTKSSIAAHLKKFHHIISHRCVACPLNFVKKQYLESHFNKEHLRGYECEFCKRIFKNVHGYKRHACLPRKKMHTENQYYSKMTRSKYEARTQHKQKVYNRSKPEVQPQPRTNNKKVPVNPRHHRHNSTDSKSTKYSCDYCQETFKSRSDIENHIERVHVKRTYKCSQCNENFECQEHLTIHTARCNTALTDMMSGKSSGAGYLKQHMRHDDEQKSGGGGDSCKPSDFAPKVEQDIAIVIKEEIIDVDLDIGPTVLQHMDIQYNFNQAKVERLPLKNKEIVKSEPDSSPAEDIVLVEN